jgi:DNA-binding CsgD family transcriptional regulator
VLTWPVGGHSRTLRVSLGDWWSPVQIRPPRRLPRTRAALERVRFTSVPQMIELLVRCAAYVPLSLSGMPPDARPTARELEILRAVVEHGSVLNGAQALGIARATARNTLTKLYKRMGVTGRSQAVAWADDHVPEWRG